MAGIPGRIGALILLLLLCAGCGAAGEHVGEPPESTMERPEELYKKALQEDVLVVYTVSTRVVQTKESFESAYPGLSVEVRDLRSPSLIEAVEKEHQSSRPECDVVLCNDNSGQFRQHLVDTGLVVPWLPADIAAHTKDNPDGNGGSFLYEAEMLFYSSLLYDTCPISNLWELTEERFRGRIYMPNPLNSFSTYALCGAMLQHTDELAEAYRLYAGKELQTAAGETAAECFWRAAAANILFTNSSDEVIEALSNGDADFGFSVSSKLRYRELGYRIEPVWNLTPFTGCRTSYAVMIAADSRNRNTAKLFIRYIMGETDGKGEGYLPFRTAGTWSARDDVPDGNDVPLSEVDLIVPDQEALILSRDKMQTFWSEVIRDSEKQHEEKEN